MYLPDVFFTPYTGLLLQAELHRVVTPCGLVAWKWRQYDAMIRWCLLTCPHAITAQETKFDIFTAVRISDPHTELYLAMQMATPHP
jgi:hypothetical protein